MPRLTREPRNWRANGLAYAGHFAQGIVAGAILPILAAPYLYTNYQRAEWQAYWRRNEAQDYVADDMVSRDLADYLAGYYVGSIVGIVAWLLILL